MENLDPPSPPKSRMGKWRVFALRAASSLIWGDGGLLFHFILSKIVGGCTVWHEIFAGVYFCGLGIFFLFRGN